VLVFLAMFLALSFANMLFTPGYNASAGGNVVYHKLEKRADFKKANYWRVFDRSTIDTDQSDTVQFFPKCIILLLAGFCISGMIAKLHPEPQALIYNRHFAYLAFRNLRI